MIDINQIEQYTESNRIEAKKALGGLPESIWETYSAFANTLGGVILLGVAEYRDRSLHTVDLPNPEVLVREFWEGVTDPKKVSANILAEEDVAVEVVNGHRIIVIRVPAARPQDRPVYIDGDRQSGSYYRRGDGDYRLTEAEIAAMQKTAEI